MTNPRFNKQTEFPSSLDTSLNRGSTVNLWNDLTIKKNDLAWNDLNLATN